MMMARLCPKCGASVPGEDASLTCRYCGTSLTAPQTPEPAPAIGAPGKRHALLYAALGVPAVLLGVLALVVLVRHNASPSTSNTPTTAALTTEPPPPAALPPSAPAAVASLAPPAKSEFADVAFEFGENGKGPGQLGDAFQIAVDPNGDSYVSLFNSRRIHHFDPAGKFVGSFELGEGTQDNLVQGLAATYDGHLWVTRGGDLVKLALPSGKVVRTIQHQKPQVSYQGVAVDATNGLYATNIGAITFISTNGRLPQSDNIRKLDKNGNLLAAWKDVGGKTGASLAVDGEGNLYVAERRSPYIDILDPNGKVKARFSGVHGSGAGIVVDGKRRIFTGGRGITVFDATGNKLGRIGDDEVKSIALGGPKGQLYVLIENGPVRVLTLH
jgi:sugar lactone lactonase YvrE